jgi:hypothetical protein
MNKKLLTFAVLVTAALGPDLRASAQGLRADPPVRGRKLSCYEAMATAGVKSVAGTLLFSAGESSERIFAIRSGGVFSGDKPQLQVLDKVCEALTEAAGDIVKGAAAPSNPTAAVTPSEHACIEAMAAAASGSVADSMLGGRSPSEHREFSRRAGAILSAGHGFRQAGLRVCSTLADLAREVIAQSPVIPARPVDIWAE